MFKTQRRSKIAVLINIILVFSLFICRTVIMWYNLGTVIHSGSLIDYYDRSISFTISKKSEDYRLENKR